MLGRRGILAWDFVFKCLPCNVTCPLHHLAIKRRTAVEVVLAEHLLPRCTTVLVRCQFIVLLHFVYRKTGDFRFTFPPQFRTYRFEDGTYDVFKKVVPTHI